MKTFAGFPFLFKYDFESNRKIIEFFEAQDPTDPKGLWVFTHLVSAYRMWLSRLKLQLEAPKPDLWPKEAKPWDWIKGEMGAIEKETLEYIKSATEETLAAPITYYNFKGEPTTKYACDILTSILLHSAYHRGQIALIAGKGERAAPFTDYIFSAPDASREG